MVIADKIGSEYIGGRAWWRRCRITGMDMAVEEIWDGNRRDVVRRRWQNGLEEQRRDGKISTGNDYQAEGVSLIR